MEIGAEPVALAPMLRPTFPEAGAWLSWLLQHRILKPEGLRYVLQELLLPIPSTPLPIQEADMAIMAIQQKASIGKTG